MNSKIVRVGVSNNFNCTNQEYSQLKGIADINKDKTFFINSNIKTPALENINNYDYKAVVTANLIYQLNLDSLIDYTRLRIRFLLFGLSGFRMTKRLLQLLRSYQKMALMWLSRIKGLTD